MNKYDIQTALICSLRYALGRKSYITQEISYIIEDNINEIDNNSMAVMIRDIAHALSTNNYGTECDKVIWSNLLKKLMLHEAQDKI